MDVAGVVLLGAGLLAVMFGFAFLGAGSARRLVAVPGARSVGLTAGLLFVRHIRRPRPRSFPPGCYTGTASG